MSDNIKHVIDGASLAAALASLAAWLPPLAALASLVWTCIRIVEWWRGKRSSEVQE